MGIAQLNVFTARDLIEDEFGVFIDASELRSLLLFNDVLSIQTAAAKARNDLGLLDVQYRSEKFQFTAYALSRAGIQDLNATEWNVDVAVANGSRIDPEIVRARLDVLFPDVWNRVLIMWEFGGFLSHRTPGMIPTIT